MVVFSIVGLILAAGTVAAIFDKSDYSSAPAENQEGGKTVALTSAVTCAPSKYDEAVILKNAQGASPGSTALLRDVLVDKEVITVGVGTSVSAVQRDLPLIQILVLSGVHQGRTCWMPLDKLDY